MSGKANPSKNDSSKPAKKRRIRDSVPVKAAALGFDMAHSAVGTALKILGTVILVLLLTGMLFTCVFAYYVKTCLITEMDLSLDDFRLSESSTLWYQDGGGEWRKFTTLTGTQKRVWVDYEDIPEYMMDALVAIEDKRFYEHKGVDWYRTAGAFVEMFARMENSYGGSTITQQLIKNLTGNDQVTIQRKLTEIFGALELEKKHDKQDIIEWYLNAVYFGEGCWGVQTAAQTYFGKDVKDLSLAECASIVGITNKPTYYDPFYNEENNKERQEIILREMYDQGYIDYNTYKEAVAEELVFSYTPAQSSAPQQIYSYYEEVVIDDVIKDLMKLRGISREAASSLVYNGGYNIYTCIDPNLQATVDSVYTDLDRIPGTWGSDKQLQSAIVLMDPYDGRILALSGGVGEKTINFGLNRATGTYRSPGSSIKPLASYGPAVDMGYITPNTYVDDSPYIRLSGTNWYPSNDGGQNYGVCTIYQALTWSLNTVAAQIVDKIGPDASYDYLTNRLGFTSLVPDDISYAPMALGQMTYGVTVREMAQGFCSFVNDGIFTYGRTYSLVTDGEGNVVIDNAPQTIAAFEPNTAHVMTYMMKNAVENGTGGDAALWYMPVAGKTGSSTDYKDRWFVGCTPYYVAAVWTGYDQPERIHVSGNPAAKLWRYVMDPIHKGLDWQGFSYPYIGPDTGIFGITQTEDEDEDEDIITDESITGDNNTGGNTDNNTGNNTGNDYGGNNNDDSIIIVG